jgi:pilus assembly protein Flp/PilA
MLTKIYTCAQAYLNKEDGATAIEYGLIAAGIAVVIAGAVFALGGDISALFGSVSDSLNNAGAEADAG